MHTMRQRFWVGQQRGRRGAQVFCLLFGLIIACSTSGVTAPTDDQTEARIANAMQGWQRFQSSRSLEDLHSTITQLLSVVNIPNIAPQNYVARRRAVVRAWAPILRTIEANLDPTFNPHDLNQLPNDCLAPPADTGIVSCFDYQDIRDPQERAAFIAEIHENEMKQKRVAFQSRLRYLDNE